VQRLDCRPRAAQRGHLAEHDHAVVVLNFLVHRDQHVTVAAQPLAGDA
jgi:hypothetical protein